MFDNISKPVQVGIAISMVIVVSGLTAIFGSFAWRSLTSEEINLQIANENSKASARLNQANLKVEKAKLVTDISHELVGGVEERIEQERSILKQELLAEIQSVQGSYCSNQLSPLKEKIEAIEARSVLGAETEKVLEKAKETLADASAELEASLAETEEEIEEKEEAIKIMEGEENQE